MSDGSIVIDCSMDSKEVLKELDKLGYKFKEFEKDTNKTSSIFGKVASGIGSFAKIGTKVVTGLVGASVTAITGLSTMGLKYNSTMENYNANFEVLLGSQEKALQHVETLKKMGASTPFEMGDLAEASKTLLAFGISAEDSITVMQQLGDISLGNKEKLNGLALVMGQVASSGKLTGQDLMQFINQGFNPLNEIAKKTGESMSDLKDRMSEGKVSYEEVAEAIASATAEGGQFYGGMEKASKTIEGRISTLKDNFNSLLGTVTQGLTGTFGGVIETAIGYVDKLNNAFEVGGINGVVAELGTIASEVVNQIALALPSVLNLGIDIVNNLIMGISSNLPSIMNSAINILNTLVNAIATLLPMLLEMGLNMLITLGQGIAQSIPNLIPIVLNCIITMCDTIISNLPTIFDTAIEIIFAIVEGIISALPTLIEEVPRIINEFCSKLYSQLPKLLQKGVELLLEIGKGLIKALPTFIKNIPQILQAMLNVWTLFNWASMGKNAIEWIKNGIMNLKDTLPTTLANIGRNALQWIKNTFLGGTGVGSGLISNIIGGIRALLGGLLGLVSSVGTSVINGIKSILSPSALVNVGRNLLSGLWNGISSMAGALYDKVASFASGITDKIKSVFKIFSPSRVMRDEIGVMLVKGIGVGFEKETPNLEDDVEYNMENLIGKMNATVSAEQGKYNNYGGYANNIGGVVNNDNGITQNITIVSPTRTPSENARAIKQESRRLLYG